MPPFFQRWIGSDVHFVRELVTGRFIELVYTTVRDVEFPAVVGTA